MTKKDEKEEGKGQWGSLEGGKEETAIEEERNEDNSVKREIKEERK